MLQFITQRLRLGLQAGVVGQQVLGVVAFGLADVGILLVEVPVGGADGVDADLPGALVFRAGCKAIRLAAPPSLLGIKLFDTNGFGLVVTFSPRRYGCS